MSAQERPMIATYEPVGALAAEQELVHRPMNEEEYAQHLEEQAQLEVEREAEAAAQPAILEQLEALTAAELAEVRRLLRGG